MKRTEKSIANRRQKSIVNSRQDKSRANSRQGKPKGYDRDKAKYEANYEEKHSTEESCSQPVPKHLRTDADVQERQWELKLDDVIRPSQRSTSTRKSWSTRRSSRQLRNSDTESPEYNEGFSQLEAVVRWQSAQQSKVVATSRRPWQQPRRISNRDSTKTA